MIPAQMQMLWKLHDIMKTNESLEDIPAFERLIEWLAVQASVQIGITTQWMKESTHIQLHQELELSLLREETYDWLGEFYYRLKGAPLSPTDTTKTMADAVARVDWDPAASTPPKALCFPDCGTGADIVATFKVAGNSAVYYGLEPDVLKYRIALVNMTLYGIPSHILCADYDVIDPFMGANNWRFANVWEPVPMEEFKIRPGIYLENSQ